MNALLFALLLGGAIAGKVVNSVDGQPVPAVTVVLEGTEPSGNPPQVDSYIVETDAEGAFRIENAAAGSYRASVRREGFAAPRTVTRVAVEPGKPASAVTIRLTPLGAISGRVADPDGDPIAEAVVEVLRHSWATGKKELRVAGTVRTNDAGEYRIFGLEPGRYRLRASQSFRAVGSSSRYLTIRGSKVEQAFGVTYFPAANDAAGAAELDLGAGGELRNISVQLRPQLLYSIRATVTGGNTAAASQVAIGISDLSDGRVASGLSMSASGPSYGRTFSLPPSKSGVYLVWAYDRQQNLRAQQVITVTGADVDVMLTVAPVLALSGTVRVRGGGQVALDGVRLRLEGDQPWNRGEGAVQRDGSFTIPQLQPAPYWLRTTLPPGVYLQSIRRGDRMLETPRIDLAQGTAPLLVTLATDGGAVEGTVTGSDGEPAEGAAVVLAPGGALRGWLDQQRTATAGKDGRFELRDIAPGAYELFAWEDAEPGAPADADFRRPYEKQATAVKITAGGRHTVALKALRVAAVD